jgi:formylglycine-generating enzyme required for sulfatase activity
MVSDFGIAKILDVEGGHTLTSTNVAIGTPEYMAPEQWFNQVGAQSDIYSLGVVFYELVTGHKPYTADTPAAIFLKQTNDPLPRPRSFMPDLPEAVEQVLYKALAKKPEERYAGMGEFAAALEELATPAKAPPLPQPQIIAPVPEPERSPAPPPTPPQAEAFQIEETGPGMPVSPPVSKNETPPVDSGIIPAGLPVKAAPTRLPVSRWVWGTVGIIALVGLVALAGWGIGKYNSSLAATQTVPVQIALPMTDTPAPPTSTKPATSTRPLLPVDTGPTLTAWPTITLSPTPGQIKAPAATRVSGLGIGSTQISPKDGMMQVYVPAGEFLMGSDKTKDSQAFDNELPQHTVYLDAFWIDQTEVTNAEYAGCAASGQCTPPHETSSSNRSSYYGNSQFDSYPVINMDWSQATAYCAWAGRRLPSEAEWEKAARGTDSRIYPWGNDISCNQSNYWGKDGGCKGDTSRVGSYPSGASPYGALDMAGNVWEWVNDWFGSSYYQNSPARNPGGPDSGTSHVLRGGSWNINVRLVRSAYRSDYAPVNRLYFIGFRCAASP